MAKKVHKIKLLSKYFEDVDNHIKTAEVRYNDRNYEVGDWLVFLEWDGEKQGSRYISRRITLVTKLDEIGLKKWVLICMI